MKYINYTSIDFVMDEYFQQWVLHPDKQTDAYWYQWLKDHPEKDNEIKEARKLILLQRFKHAAIPNTRLAAIRENIKAKKGSSPAIAISKPAKSWFWYKVAASLVIAIMAGISIYLLKFDYPRTVATGYGQIKEIMLPDSSKVTLNANSMVEYSPDWTKGKVREIWLEGEAFFNVEKLAICKKNRQDSAFTKFIVHVDGLDVEVVGTQFNVNNRNGAVKVVLNEGKVRIKANDGKQVNMMPGEMLTYSVKSKDLLKSLVNPKKHISWKNKHLIFEAQPLQELADILETNFGINVVFANPMLANRKITTTLPADNLEVILEALQTVYDIRIKKEGNTVLLHH